MTEVAPASRLRPRQLHLLLHAQAETPRVGMHARGQSLQTPTLISCPSSSVTARWVYGWFVSFVLAACVHCVRVK